MPIFCFCLLVTLHCRVVFCLNVFCWGICEFQDEYIKYTKLYQIGCENVNRRKNLRILVSLICPAFAQHFASIFIYSPYTFSYLQAYMLHILCVWYFWYLICQMVWHPNMKHIAHQNIILAKLFSFYLHMAKWQGWGSGEDGLCVLSDFYLCGKLGVCHHNYHNSN